jgi:hypothetical protein
MMINLVLFGGGFGGPSEFAQFLVFSSPVKWNTIALHESTGAVV